MAGSKPTNEVTKLKNNLSNYYLFKNLKEHSELLLFWLRIFSLLVQLLKKHY